VAPSADAPVQKVFGLQMVAPIIPYDLFKSLTEEIYIAKIVRAAQSQSARSACVNAPLTHHTHAPHTCTQFLEHLEHADTEVALDREADNQWREENKRMRSESVECEQFAVRAAVIAASDSLTCLTIVLSTGGRVE
jgi:hypothetical protein